MSNKFCLIVDDSDIIRRVTKQLLNGLRFDTGEAVDAMEAVASCRTTMPDAILLDWSLPEVSGIECLQALRKLPSGDKPAIFYCTTENDPVEFKRARAAGATDVLVKPYDRETLSQKLADAGLV
jgi:two-component system, chemotaxis family, chemotaxis protein CheY